MYVKTDVFSAFMRYNGEEGPLDVPRSIGSIFCFLPSFFL